MIQKEYLEEIQKTKLVLKELEKNLNLFDNPKFSNGTRVRLVWCNGVVQTGTVVDTEVERDLRTKKFYQYPKVKLDDGKIASTWQYNCSNGTLDIEAIKEEED